MAVYINEKYLHCFVHSQGPRGPPGSIGDPGPDGRRVRGQNIYLSQLKLPSYFRVGKDQKEIQERLEYQEKG